FNAAVKKAAEEALKAQGCDVVVSDLYAMKFKATATEDDVTGESNPEHFVMGRTMTAWQEGRLSPDISFRILLMNIFSQFPMYWFTMPAIMKGWIDRVLTKGLPSALRNPTVEGIFKNKKAMLSFTTSSHETMFSASGINGDINVTLWPIQNGILHFCGFQVLPPQIFWAPAYVPQEARASMLETWTGRLQGLLNEAPFFLHLKHSGSPYGLTVGHHLGKPLPPNSQMKAGV
uniref:Flavodoxin-like fold domain-containing protein n=1 Tax=Denticeps clupeoides TaxID=299321 RepID=A0AAY4BW90_9TELE